MCMCIIVFFFQQKTAYEMRISDWSSDVCSSDLGVSQPGLTAEGLPGTLCSPACYRHRRKLECDELRRMVREIVAGRARMLLGFHRRSGRRRERQSALRAGHMLQ